MQDKVDRVKVKERKKDHKFIKTRVFLEMEKERERERESPWQLLLVSK